jgi:hypothetical protein
MELDPPIAFSFSLWQSARCQGTLDCVDIVWKDSETLNLFV